MNISSTILQGGDQTELFEACKHGNFEKCLLLLKDGMKADSINHHDNNRTILHYVVGAQKIDIIDKLCKIYKMSPTVKDTSGVSPLAIACAQRDSAVLKSLLSCELVKPSDLNSKGSEGLTPLMLAAQAACVENLDLLIKHGAKVREQDNSGQTVLHHSVSSNYLECVKYLLAVDAFLARIADNKGHTPLQLAVISNSKEIVSCLLPASDLNAQDSEGHCCIHWATACGNSNLINKLVKLEADPNLPDKHGAHPLHYAVRMCGEPSMAHRGMECTLRLLQHHVDVDCQDEGQKTPLLWAASVGAEEACRLLLKAGADILAEDRDGLTALHCSSCCNHTSVVELLLRDFNCPPDVPDRNGCTPLFYAVKKDLATITNTLLKYGASANWRDKQGKSPVHYAVSVGATETLRLLRNFGADLCVCSNREQPIHVAAKDGKNAAVEYLLGNGCDINARDASGRTALHIAASRGHALLCKLLIDKKAEVNAVFQDIQGKPLTALDCALLKSSSECVQLLQYHQAKRGEDLYLSVLQVDEHVEDELTEHPTTFQTAVPGPTFSERLLDSGLQELHINNNNSKTSAKRRQSQKKVKKTPKPEIGSIGDVSQPETKDDVEQKVKEKMKNWQEHKQDSLEFLGPILDAEAESLKELKEYAEEQKMALLRELDALKRNYDENCNTLVKELSSSVKSERQKSAASQRSIKIRADKVNKRLQKISSSSGNEERCKSASPRRPKSFGGLHTVSRIQQIQETTEEERMMQHKEWLKRKNKQYNDKKESTWLKSCPKLDNHLVCNTLGIQAIMQDSSEAKLKRVLSVTRRRPPTVPDYEKSPFSNRITSQCGIYKAQTTSDTNKHHNLHGTEVARRQRLRGDELNTKIYPKSWQMMQEELNEENHREAEEIIDLKACYTPRWDGSKRPRNTLRFQPPKTGSHVSASSAK